VLFRGTVRLTPFPFKLRHFIIYLSQTRKRSRFPSPNYKRVDLWANSQICRWYCTIPQPFGSRYRNRLWLFLNWHCTSTYSFQKFTNLGRPPVDVRRMLKTEKMLLLCLPSKNKLQDKPNILWRLRSPTPYLYSESRRQFDSSFLTSKFIGCKGNTWRNPFSRWERKYPNQALSG